MIQIGDRQWSHRLALGTVQFGMDYGVSNQHGKVPRDEVRRILDEAALAGIQLLDTASAYGSSEAVIGAATAAGGPSFDIVSKLPPGCAAHAVETSVRASLERLGADALYGVLVHRFEDFKDPSVRDALTGCKAQGLARRVGVSVYFPREVQWLLERDVAFDLVQLPFNLFDQRFASLLTPLRERGVQVHCRSVFLQGLFFLPPEIVRQRFPAAYEPLCHFRRTCSDAGLSVSCALLNFALGNPGLDRVLIGVASSAELRQNLGCYRDFRTCGALGDTFTRFGLDDEGILLPINWG